MAAVSDDQIDKAIDQLPAKVARIIRKKLDEGEKAKLAAERHQAASELNSQQIIEANRRIDELDAKLKQHREIDERETAIKNREYWIQQREYKCAMQEHRADAVRSIRDDVFRLAELIFGQGNPPAKQE
jgi:hypothetical protein